jgi:hypothetical protein
VALTDYLAPMGAAIWSAPANEMLDFPAENFVAFFSNHRLLQYDRPVRRTVKDDSQRYVENLTAGVRDHIKFGSAVTRIERTPHGVILHDSHGHTITIQDSLFQIYRREVDFIQRYVFPGGMLPSPEILKTLGERFGVPVIRERIFGQDYARTLAIWRSNFRAAWPNLMPSGFDDRFRRLWEYYLAYCEAGLLSGNIDVRQVVFAKSG